MNASWYMAGTEGTGAYVGVGRTYRGQVGYRTLGTSFRVRVEPKPEGRDALSRTLTRANGWKQPDSTQDRYSIVASVEEFANALGLAIRALDPTRIELNPDVPTWVREIVANVRSRVGIFISYRRVDSQREVRRIYDRLTAHFVSSEVFVDLDSIPLGKPFQGVLADALQKTAAGLVVVGPQWLSIANPDGSRRLDDPADYVRMEVSRLLAMDIPVIPCLVAGAALPGPEELPAPLRPLVNRQGVSLRPDFFEHDLDRLLGRLGQYAA